MPAEWLRMVITGEKVIQPMLQEVRAFRGKSIVSLMR